MKALHPGTKYALTNHLDKHPENAQELLFVRYDKKSEKSKELELVHDGTTNEEVLKVLIHRMKVQNERLSDADSKKALKHIENALSALEKRTEKRKKKGVEGTLKK